jgi:hypothetical protein
MDHIREGGRDQGHAAVMVMMMMMMMMMAAMMTTTCSSEVSSSSRDGCPLADHMRERVTRGMQQ